MLETLASARYQIIRKIGEGGGGEVFLGHDTWANSRAVAIKRLADGLADAVLAHEFAIAYRLRHPHLVRTLDFGRVAPTEVGLWPVGAPYLVQMFCEGEPALRWAANPSANEVLWVGAQLAAALATLHALGIRHGDVKPHNVLVTDKGHATLIDLGLAARGKGSTVSGTLGYMAPEALAGEAELASDIFALGQSLLHLLITEAPAPQGAAPAGTWQSILAPLLHPDPSRRPTAAQAFMHLRDALPASFQDRLNVLRDATFSHGGFWGRANVQDALEACTQNTTGTQVLRLVGDWGSGKTAALEEIAAFAIAKRYEVPGLVRSAGKSDLAALCGALALELPRATSPWQAFFELAEALSQALGNRRVALLFDDVAPNSPLDAFVRFCGRMGARGPRCLLAIAVTAEPNMAKDAHDVVLSPLGEEDIAHTIQTARPLRPHDVNTAVALHKASAGLPGAVVTILGQHAGDALLQAAQLGTLARDDVFWAGTQERLARLDSLSQRLVFAVAALTPPAQFEALLALPSLATLSIQQLNHASAVGLLRVRHQAQATSIELSTLSARGLLANRAPTDLLQELVAQPLCDADLGQLWHRLGNRARAQPYLLRAAKQAAAQLRLEEALSIYAQVLLDTEIAPAQASEVRGNMARLLITLGRADEALAHAQSIAHPERRIGCAEAWLALGNYKQALQALTEGSAPAEENTDHVLALAARAAMLAGEHQRATQIAQTALARPLARLGELHNVLGMVAFYQGTLDVAKDHIHKARAAAETARQTIVADQARANLALVLHKAGDLGAAEQAYEDAVASAQKQHDLPKQVARLTNLASLRQERGAVGAALASYDEAASLAELLGGERESIRIALNRANLLVWLGDTQSAQEVLQPALAGAVANQMQTEAAYLQLVAAEIAIAQGNRGAARELIDQAKKIFAASHTQVGLVECDIVLAQLLAKERDSEALRLARHAAQEAFAMGRERLGGLATLWAACAANATQEGQTQAQALVDVGTRLDDADLLWMGFALLAQAELARGLVGAAELSGIQAQRYLNIAQSRVPARFDTSYLGAWYRRDLLALAQDATGSPQQAHKSFDRLLAINREIAQDHDPRRLLERIIDAAIALSGAERGFIVLKEEDSQELRIGVARNIDQQGLEQGDLRFSRSIAQDAIERGQPISTVDAQDDARFRAYLSVHQMQLRSVFCLPLRAQGNTLGALYLDHRHRVDAFDKNDIALLTSFGDQAAIALANARLLAALAERTQDLEHSRQQIETLNQRLAKELEARSHELDLARAQGQDDSDSFKHGMIGVSPKMREVFRVIDRVADKDVPVNILGESGTGKELVARAIHAASSRNKGPFVSVNCGAIPAELLESELFGHEKGAFTGAVRQKPGLFEVAQSGTLFLDEIGDMPLSMQVKLLRVLQQKEFRRVGGTQDLKTDARVISATHRDLHAWVRDGRFREDLWYRLNVVELMLPPLRERKADVPHLIMHLLARHGGKTPLKITKDALAALLDYDWPGNVRELENELMRALALAEGKIAAHDLSPKLNRKSPRPQKQEGNLREAVDEFERMALEQALTAHKGRVSATAQTLGLTRAGLYKKLHKHGLIVDKV